ncbi:MAG: hypothetical protein QOJ56_2965 [Mycobacterium sp.]|nr:hypothetical protein [Mycobacterium sp.]
MAAGYAPRAEPMLTQRQRWSDVEPMTGIEPAYSLGKPILGSNRYSESPAQSPNRIAHIPSTSVVLVHLPDGRGIGGGMASIRSGRGYRQGRMLRCATRDSAWAGRQIRGLAAGSSR